MIFVVSFPALEFSTTLWTASSGTLQEEALPGGFLEITNNGGWAFVHMCLGNRVILFNGLYPAQDLPVELNLYLRHWKMLAQLNKDTTKGSFGEKYCVNAV